MGLPAKVRSDNAVIFGVCGGVARKLGLDPRFVRIMSLILLLGAWLPIIPGTVWVGVLYMAGALFMPEE